MADALPVTLGVYRRASALAAPLAGLVIGRRLKQGKEDPARIGERRGTAGAARPPGPLVWIHGASVGEVLAAAELIERLRALNLRVLLTSGTRTSAEIVARRFPPDVIHQFIPFDVPAFVDRFLDHWKPGLALFIESDLWPNLLLSAAERRVPLVLINGRMSPRSFPRWRKARGTISALLSCFDLCLTQSDIDHERFAILGSPNVATSGNLKLDIKPLPADPQKLERLKSATGRRTVFVAASTHPGEEEIITDAHRRLAADIPSLLTIIVPRHPQRGPAVAQIAAASGLQVQLRSRGHLPSADTDIYVADTMGELGLFYRIAPVVFMGGSLVAHGGQNPIEPAKLDAAILHGPHVFNFSDIYASLDREEGALLAHDPEEFVTLLRHLLGNPIARNRLAASAQGVVTRLGGAVDKTMAALEPYLLQMRIEQERTMREPGFWYAPPSLCAVLMAPFGMLYGAVAGWRMARQGARAGLPVICVGNYHLGGAGKTPTTLRLAQMLRDLDETPFVVSRGYGGSLMGPVRVEENHHAAEVGDEPVMMARHVPVIVSRDRVEGAELARREGASVILLDDGFQNPALDKDASVIVIDAARGLGNGYVFPAGPLRAPLAAQVARTNALVVIGEGNAANDVAHGVVQRGGLVLRAAFVPEESVVAQLRDKRVLAFAGIGDPARFFATLEAHGIEVASQRAFADHHPFTVAEIEALASEAQAGSLTLVTTEKDFARIAGDPALAAHAARIVPFPVTLRIADEGALEDFLKERLRRARQSRQ